MYKFSDNVQKTTKRPNPRNLEMDTTNSSVIKDLPFCSTGNTLYSVLSNYFSTLTQPLH